MLTACYCVLMVIKKISAFVSIPSPSFDTGALHKTNTMSVCKLTPDRQGTGTAQIVSHAYMRPQWRPV